MKQTMSASNLHHFVVIVILFCLCTNVQAKKLSGYIITQNNDTIYGRFKVSQQNPRTGAYYFNSVDLEMCYLQATFCEEGKSKYKTYYPKDIVAYSFISKGKNYYFYSFIIKMTKWNNEPAVRYEFLNVAYKTKNTVVYKRLRYGVDYREDNGNMFINESNIEPTYTFYTKKPDEERIILYKEEILKSDK